MSSVKCQMFSEWPYPNFSSTSYGRTMWGQSSAEPCRTMPNKVRQECTATKYGDDVRQKTNGQLPMSISRKRVIRARSAIGEAVTCPGGFYHSQDRGCKEWEFRCFLQWFGSFCDGYKQLNETKLACSSYIQIIRLPGGTFVIVYCLVRDS